MVVDYNFRSELSPNALPGTPIQNVALPTANTNIFEAVKMTGGSGKTGTVRIYFCATVGGTLNLYRKTPNTTATLETLNGGTALTANVSFGPEDIPVNTGDEISLQYTATGGTCYVSVSDMSGAKVQKAKC